MFKYSIYFLTLVTTASAFLIVEFSTPPELQLQETGKAFHIAIDGEGYFAILDEKTFEVNYTRSGTLRRADDDRLVLCIHDREYQLEPPMCLCPNSTGLRIDRAGVVSVLCGNAWKRIGSFQLTRFKNQMALADPLEKNPVKLIPGNAIVADPGTNGTGCIVQGWSEERKLFSRHRVLGNPSNRGVSNFLCHRITLEK